jgi:nucleoside-diphosphate-sugar epimerase
MAQTPNLSGEIVNIGSPEPLTIIELAQMMCHLAGTRPDLEFQPVPPDDPTHRCPNIDKARHLLQWDPRVALADGLSATLEYFRELLA